MNAILPQEPAMQECLKLIIELDSRFTIKDGRMFGVLVCTDGTVYRAFSGLLNGKYTAEGFVPPCFDPASVQYTLDIYDAMLDKAPTEQKKAVSRACWDKLKTLYNFSCIDGTTKTLAQIMPNAPAGTGDCCAPRLLSFCYKNGKKPLSLAEFYYGKGSRNHLEFCTPCDERCKPLLPGIIGLDIVYMDDDVVVVNKPSGLLAIEGRGDEKQDCVASRVRAFFPHHIAQPCVHRLDQSTSGLMVLGLTQEAHDSLSRQFEEHTTYKEYEALVEGLLLDSSGTITLPMRLDTENRPHQIVDFENGKYAETLWEVIKTEKHNGFLGTRLRLTPKTGRTHQLRLHCAEGLHHPIFNDPLYGNAQTIPGISEQLLLHANLLSFTHPSTGERLTFTSRCPF